MSLALAALCLPGCYEDMPPLEQIEEVVAVSVDFHLFDGNLVMLDSRGNPRGRSGALEVRWTNLYNEYYSDSAQVEVEITIRVEGQPEKSAVVTMSANDILTTGVLSHGVLSVAPHQEIQLYKQWSHRTSEGEHFAGFTEFPNGVDVPTSSGRIFHAFPVHVLVSASVKTFKSRPTWYYPPNRKSYKEFLLNYCWQ